MKIAVIGYSGSGKSTLSKWLSMRYGLPILYLDSVQFLPNWRERDHGAALEIIERFMEQSHWVIDGNYSVFLRERRLREADQIIFMNFNRLNCLLRVIRRNWTYQHRTRESMADGCIEKLDWEFVRWVLLDGRTRAKRRDYRAILAAYPEKTLVLGNQRELDAFKDGLKKDALPKNGLQKDGKQI